MKLFAIDFLKLIVACTVITIVISAQDRPNIQGEMSKRPIDCNIYLLEKRSDFNRAKVDPGDGPTIRIERYLESFLDQCPIYSNRQQVEADLTTILDELAEHNLYIAKFYLKQFEEKGKGGIKAAGSRLKEITKKYPQFSKLDEVLFLLIKVDLIDKNFEEADQNYRQILNKFYLSLYICEANTLLRQVKR